jgi:hypothetical protein
MLFIREVPGNGKVFFNESMTVLKFNQNPTPEYNLEFRTVIVEIQFKINSFSASGYMGKGSMSIWIEDIQTNEIYRLTQRNIDKVVELYNNAIETGSGFPVSRFKTTSQGTLNFVN